MNAASTPAIGPSGPVRNVAVMLPFGGADVRMQRSAKLHFARLKENLAQIERDALSVGLERGDIPIHYEVSPFYTSVHSVPLEGLKAVVKADILIALIGQRNINVVYEVAVRQVVKGDVILLVQGDPAHELPVYLAHQGYIPYESPKPSDVGKAIDALAEIEFPTLITADFGERDGEIRGILNSLVKDKDTDFRKKLAEALKEIEFTMPGSTPEINQLFREVNPSRIVSAWDAYFPYCVMRVRWKKRTGEEHYEADDLLEEPVICSANRAFENLFDIARAGGVPDPNSQHKLTMRDLMTRLEVEQYMQPSTFEKFASEQRRLNDVLLFRCETDWATEALAFDGKHFHPFYDGARFLPAMFAKWTIGDLGGQHEDYYLVGYIRTDHNGDADRIASPQA